MDVDHDLDTSRQYILQHTSRTTRTYVDEVLYRIDVNTLHRDDAESLALNEIGRVKVTLTKELEKRLWDSGRQVTRLDGDNARQGLSPTWASARKTATRTSVGPAIPRGSSTMWATPCSGPS